MSKCLICGRELPVDMACLFLFMDKDNMFTGVCLSHEGTEELEALCKELKAQNKLM
jgi:hypothetical protein